jgi:ADP-dependent NAD(P)H-hydrate dehydratase
MTVERVEDPPPLPERPTDGHKGTFGSVLVVAGSRGMSGAAIHCVDKQPCMEALVWSR